MVLFFFFFFFWFPVNRETGESVSREEEKKKPVVWDFIFGQRIAMGLIIGNTWSASLVSTSLPTPPCQTLASALNWVGVFLVDGEHLLVDFLFFFYRDSWWFFLRSNGGRARTGTEEREKGQDTRFGCPPVGFRRKRLLCWSFLFFFSDGIFSERKSGRKERAAKELLDRLSLVFSCGLVLSWNRNRRKGTERWMERIGVWNHSGRLFSSKDRFFRNSRPSFRVELWLFYLEQIRVFKAG